MQPRPAGIVRRVLGSGPGAGALVLMMLFLLDFAGASLDFMGFSDEQATSIIVARFRGHIILHQLFVLWTYAAVGAGLGAAGAGLGRLWDWSRRRSTSRARSVARGVGAAILGHAWFLARSMIHHPQLYTEALFDHGGWRRRMMVALTDHVSRARLEQIAWVVVALAVVIPLVRPRGRDWVRAFVQDRQRALKRRPRLALGVGLALAIASAGWWLGARRAAHASTGGKPNVLLIAVDSLRADRLFAPDAASRFPALARLAARGVRFREAHATVPRTFPSFVTLLTGRWPYHHGIRHMFPTTEARHAIGPALPGALADAGYETAVVSDYAGEIFSRTPMGFRDVETPYFDMSTIVEQRGLQVHPNVLPYVTTSIGRTLFPAIDALPEHADPEVLADRAIAALERVRGRPFFLTVFFSAAHFPYAAPDPWYRKFGPPGYDGPFRYQKPPLSTAAVGPEDAVQIRALYDGAVAAADAAIGRLLDRLESDGLDGNTIVVLLADHGENLYDVPGRGMGHGDHLLGSAADHVPLVIVDPVHAFKPRDVAGLVRDVDVAPTIARLAGIAPPPADGVDLAPLLRGERASLDLDAYTETEFWFTPSGPGFGPDERLPYPGITGATDLARDGDIFIRPEWQDTIITAKHRAIRSGAWKLVYVPTRGGPRWSLFDVAHDPDERTNVAAAHPAELAALRKKLEAWMTADGRTVLRDGFAVTGGATLPGEAPSAAPASIATPKTTPSRARLPGDAVAYRLLDHAADATVSGPDLAQAWQALAYPAKIESPYVAPGAAGRVVELALADADVAAYGRPKKTDAPRAPVKFDAVWNRTRAVYESKSSLFAPAGTRYEFALPPVAEGELRLDLAIPPGAAAVEFTVTADGRELLRRLVSAREAGAWIHETLPIAGARKLVLATTSDTAAAPAVWGDPLLIARDGGAPGPNVLLVVIDTLRRDALPAMPRLRALADRGVWFDQAITAAAWTRPSILAMLGGDSATAIGQSAEDMIPAEADRRRFYAVAPPLLPRVLETGGWQSVAIGNNFFLLGYPLIGLTLGFDEVADVRHPVLDTPAITAAAIGYLQAHAREPFFLHLHYDAPHWPYTPPPEYRRRVEIPPGFPDDAEARNYLGEAAYADDYLGQVLDELDRLKLGARTLVVVVGDHGEIFDHAHDHIVDSMKEPTLHHHGWSAYDELLRVPLVMAMPGTLPVKKVLAQASLVDLEPTILEVLGLPARAGARGRSLAPLWRGEPVVERPAFVEGQDVRAVRAGGWAYLRRSDAHLTLPGGKHVTVAEELYDLAKDPLEHHDLVADDPTNLARMRALFAAEAPVGRDVPLPVVHLRTAPDAAPHVVDGVLRTDGTISIRAMTGAEAAPLDAHALKLTLRGAAIIDLVIDPPNARIELGLRKDGAPLPANALLVGPFALPLFADRSDGVITGDRLGWLDAARAPVLGARGELFLWRDPGTLTQVAPATAEGSSEVAGMMRRWGYAQPGK